jgi:hypothetical protein
MNDQSGPLLAAVHSCSERGNQISVKMIEFLDNVRDQPIGFRPLGQDFLGISKILNALEESLKEHFRTNQPFPERAIPELMRIIHKTIQDFSQLQLLLQKFMDYELGGTFAQLQKMWRKFVADKDIAKVQSSLQESKGALNMTMLLTNM